MKVYLIHPKAPPTLESLSEALPWWQVGAHVAPLELARLAALTPAEVEVKVCDQNAGEAVNFEEVADLVVAVAGPDQIPGLRYLSGRFRARKIPFALGGSYVSENPSRVDFVDVKLIGDLEAVYPALLNDRLTGAKRKKEYVAQEPADLSLTPAPKWEVLDLTRYRMGAVEVSRPVRGATGSSVKAGEGSSETGQTGATPLPASRRKPVERVLQEIEALTNLGLRRIRLETDDLVADPAYAITLLEALAELNGRQRPKLRFETRVDRRSVHTFARLDLLSMCNIRRIEMDLNDPQVDQNHLHEDPRQECEVVRRLLEHGIRVAGRLTVFREGDDPQSWLDQVAVARESNATPWIHAARALPGTGLYDRLREAGRLIQGGRDAELRQELFDPPNYTSRTETREAQAEQLKSLILEMFTSQQIERRLRSYLAEAKHGPVGGIWPPPEDLRALGRMMSGTVQNRSEQRVRMVVRTFIGLSLTRPPATTWSQVLEQLLEEMATRSYVRKVDQGLPLEANTPVTTWKQKAIGMGAKVIAALGSQRGVAVDG